jgi:SAM domain (Sterile alpha motif)
MDVAEWLRGVGLEKYMPAFRTNDIDGEVLSRLTGEDLRELGVNSIGHRDRGPPQSLGRLARISRPKVLAPSGFRSIHISTLRMPAAMTRCHNLRSTDQKRGPAAAPQKRGTGGRLPQRQGDPPQYRCAPPVLLGVTVGRVL